jgi:hypothetical protein
MKREWRAHTVRLNCTVRADIKAVIQDVAAKWHRREGGYVSEGRVVAEAVEMLIKREGIPLPVLDPPEVPTRVPRKPPREATRRKKAAVA